jgi:hypothetical protein
MPYTGLVALFGTDTPEWIDYGVIREFVPCNFLKPVKRNSLQTIGFCKGGSECLYGAGIVQPDFKEILQQAGYITAGFCSMICYAMGISAKILRYILFSLI